MMPKKKSDPIQEEREAIKQSEAPLDASRNDQFEDEQQNAAEEYERGADATPVMPAEASAVNTDTEAAQAAEGVKEKNKAKKTTADRIVASKPKRRSAKYQKAVAGLDQTIERKIEEAIKQVQASSYSKFDGTVELHARLIMKKKDANESIRGLVTLPGGAPKTVKAVVLTEQLIDDIATTKRIEADIYLATPALMSKVAKIAKILGPQGKMPNPKTGTVTTDPDAVLAEIQSGRIEYRADANGIVHVGIGKVSWSIDKLCSNAETIIAAIGANRLRSLYLTATMGPSIAVDLTTIGA